MSVWLGTEYRYEGLALVGVGLEMERRDGRLALVSVCLGDGVLRWRDGIGMCLTWRRRDEMAGWHC